MKPRVFRDKATKRNKRFEHLCYKTQEQIKQVVDFELRQYGEVQKADGYIYMQGNFPVLLVAHMDTVHKELPREIIYKDGKISSPQGIGGDDRCGIYMIMEILKRGYRPSVLFCEDEEIGCVGSTKFAVSKFAESLNGTFNYIIELDRNGSNDAVYYECDNPEFEKFIEMSFFKKAFGSYTDICEIAPALDCSAVNFSCGYYKQHTTDEYVVLSEMEVVIDEVCKLLDRTTCNDKFEWIEAKHTYTSYGFGSYGYGGYGSYDNWNRYDDTYVVIYGTETVEEDYITASSEEEAIGIFLIQHPFTCYNDILEVMDIYSYEEICEYGTQM